MQKQLTAEQKLDNLTDSIVADIIAMTDEEIMQEATEEFGTKENAIANADEIRTICINAIEKRMGVIGGV